MSREAAIRLIDRPENLKQSWGFTETETLARLDKTGCPILAAFLFLRLG
jgi:hypothetical protein